jgi:CheY-like chemotaxis protein
LTDVLGELATSTGHRRAVIGFPTLGPLQLMAGLTNAAGLESVTATNGQALFEAATSSADTELILISNRIDHQPAFETVQLLLRDPRTANVPICVVAEPGDRERMTRWYEKFRDVFVALRPEQPEEMQQIVARARQIAGDRIVPAPLRALAATSALDALTTLTDAPPDIFDVRRFGPLVERALYRPTTATQAVTLAARLSTPKSQVALVDLASTATQPLKMRQAAAAAFADSVHRVGVRLSPSEIVRQYDRYNQSKSLDKPTQQVLGSVLDTIEGKQK